jgi:hypothetical protein
MHILRSVTTIQQVDDILRTCRLWDEGHPSQPAEREWVEEMIQARDDWYRMIQRNDPRQSEAYERYAEFRERLPYGLVLQLFAVLSA